MILSVIMMFVFIVILLLLKANNRYAWAVSITLFSLMIILFAQLLQIIKVYSYDNFFALENWVYFALHKIKISNYDIKTVTNIGISMYLISMCMFLEPTMEQKNRMLKNMIFVLFVAVTIVSYFILNMSWFAEKLYIKLSLAQTEAERTKAILYSDLIVAFDYIIIFGYMIMPFVYFIKKYRVTRIIYRKMQVKMLALCMFAIDVFFVAFVLFGPVSSVIVPSYKIYDVFLINMNLSDKFMYIYLFLTIIVLSVLLWSIVNRKIFDYKDFFAKKKTIKKSEIMPSDIKHIFHSYKNTMFSILVLQEKARKNSGNPDGELALDGIKKIAEDFMKQSGECIDMFNAVNFNVTDVDIIKCIKKAIYDIRCVYDVDIIENYYEEELYAFVDKKKITEIIYNMLINAVEAIEKKNAVDGFIKVSIYREAKWLCISIWDNGCGMTKKERKNVFKPFYTSKKTHKNWGIGLSDSYNVVEECGGMINVESEHGKYSEFQILLHKAKV